MKRTIFMVFVVLLIQITSCAQPGMKDLLQNQETSKNDSSRGMGDLWPTQIHVQNNTSLSWAVTGIQSGSHVMDGDEWWAESAPLDPWQKDTVVLGTNRDSGIHRNTDFYLTVKLETQGELVQLKIKLRGKIVSSTLSNGVSGPGFDSGFTSDREWRTDEFSIGEKEFQIKYRAYYSGWLDDLIYVIQEKDPFPASVSLDSDQFSVLAYNIYMLSGILGKDQSLRAQYIPEAVKGYDAVVLSEAFDNGVRESLVLAMADQYPYSTEILDQSGSLEDGGVIILSRWPIIGEAQHVFTMGVQEDQLAAKGVSYAAIDKQGTIYNLFGTHTQAWKDTQNQVDVRLGQLQEIRTFAESLNISDGEPVIVAGDLNIDKYANAWGEYEKMYQKLDAYLPDTFGFLPSYDIHTNTYATGDEIEYLDYVLVLKGWKIPVENRNEVRVYRSIADDMEGKWDLSDHYGVAGLLSF